MSTAARPDVQDYPPGAMPDQAREGARRTIETRFGPMEFASDQAIVLPRGILGFAEHKNFGLAPLPNNHIPQLMLLQSLDDPETSFLVLPVDMAAGIIGEDDLANALATMSIKLENAVVAVIVTIRDIAGLAQVTVNLRAPILLDAERRTGWQYVLPNAKYSVRHELATAASGPATDKDPG